MRSTSKPGPALTVIPDPMIPELMRITRVRKETHDTFTMELQPSDGDARLRFAPGQFNMVYVFGAGEVPVSISGNPDDAETLVHTVRAVGAVTRAMKAKKAGDMLGIRGPFGHGWPVEGAAGRDVVLVAGGIGIAPLRPAVYHILNHREKYGKFIFLYGTRTPGEILYQHELERWRARFDVDLHITVDRAPMGWRGNVGVVTTLIGKAPVDPANTVAMICGPEVMMRFTTQEFLRKGVDMKNIYVSMERNMKCGIGLCGHCQYGPEFVCKDGPVFSYGKIRNLFGIREL